VVLGVVLECSVGTAVFLLETRDKQLWLPPGWLLLRCYECDVDAVGTSLPRVAIGVNRHDVLADKHEGWCGRLCPHSRAALLADPRARQWYHPVYEEIHALQRSKHPLVHFVVHVCPRKHLWMVSGLCNSIQTILCLLLSYFLLWLVSLETFLVLKEGVRLFGGY